MSLPFNIAIDGHSSCGKSTIAKNIAAKYNMCYVDTGAMYRAFTLYCMRSEIIKDKKIDIKRLTSSLDSIEVDFHFDSKRSISSTFLNNENVESIIRGIEVSNNVSIIAQLDIVRKKLVMVQRSIGKDGNVVMDGRDIGSKVFPDAGIKFFITARIDVRAKRRYEQMRECTSNILFKDILENLQKRDEQDTSRILNPLVQVKDSIVLDNSDLSLNEQNQFIYNTINAKINS